MSCYHDSKVIRQLIFFAVILFLLCCSTLGVKYERNKIQQKWQVIRVSKVKTLRGKVRSAIEKNLGLCSLLTDFANGNKAAYVFLQEPRGGIVSQAKKSLKTVVIDESTEKRALQTERILVLNHKSPDELLSISEIAAPIFSDKKYVLRAGFIRTQELKELQVHTEFLLFTISAIILGILFYWHVSGNKIKSLKNRLILGISSVFILCFISFSFFINYQNRVSLLNNRIKDSLSLIKVLKHSSNKFIQNKDASEFNHYAESFCKSGDFEYIAIIKDGKYIYHSDPAKINSIPANEDYIQPLFSKTPLILPNTNNYMEIYFPISDAAIIKALRTIPLSPSKIPYNLLATSVILLLSLFIIYLIINYLTKKQQESFDQFTRATKQISYGKIPLCLNLDSENEFRDLSHAYNVMLIELLKQRESNISDQINTTCHTAVNIAPGLYYSHILTVYFDRLWESINEFGYERVSENVLYIYDFLKEATSIYKNIILELCSDHVSALFVTDDKNSIINEIYTAKLLLNEFASQKSLCFDPKITLTSNKVLLNSMRADNKFFVLEKDPYFYFHASKIQDAKDLFINSQLYNQISNFSVADEIEFLSSSSGEKSFYSFKEFKSAQELTKTYETVDSNGKMLILRILETGAEAVSFETLQKWLGSSPNAEIEKKLRILIDRPNSNNIYQNDEVPERVPFSKNNSSAELNIKTVDDIISVLTNNEKDNKVRTDILKAKERYGELEPFILLNEMLKSEKEDDRCSAAYVLGFLNSFKSGSMLVQALSDENLSVHKQVIKSLQRLNKNTEK